MKLIISHWFAIGIICVILIATFFRFYNYSERWGLAYDQAHDVVVARYAVRIREFPLVGPFSSGAPIQTSGVWYWLIMVGVLFNFSSVLAPWIFITFLYICAVGALIYIGKNFYGKAFALLLGLFAAVSSSQIAQAVNVTNTGPTIFATVLAIIFMLQYTKTKKDLYLFLLAFSVSLGTSIHLSGATLLFLLLVTIFFNLPISKKSFFYIFIGILIPLLPNLIFDIQHNFVHLQSFVRYITVDQYKISLDVLGRRWMTYLGIFWPNAWTYIIGGNIFVVYFFIALFLTLLSYSFVKKQIKKEFAIILVSLICSIILIRYVRTPIFYSYLIFLHPYILIISAWTCYRTFQINKFFGACILGCIILSTSLVSFREITFATNSKDRKISKEVQMIIKKLHNSNVSLYDYKYKSVETSVPLSLYLDVKNKISEDGIKVGIASADLTFPYAQPIASGSSLFILTTSSAQLKKDEWVSVNPKSIYEATEKWYK